MGNNVKAMENYNEDNIKELCKVFVEPNNSKKYILGTNEFAKSVSNIVSVTAFIDEFSSIDTFQGKPIINSLDLIPQDTIVLSCNVWGRPLTVKKKLNNLNIRNIDYYSFLKYSGLQIKNIDYWAGNEEFYLKNIKQFERIKSILSDNESKVIFEKLINFRQTYDLSYMEGFEDIQYRQYFEDFLELNPQGESFVDVGGFDGYTTQVFIKRCPRFNKIYFLEPDSKNLDKAKLLLQDYSNIEYLELGASDKKETLRFENELGSASKVSESGSITIKVDTLDNIITEPVSYIKMDIEGSESAAIEGAKQTILNYHPRLAICVYHKAMDLIDIPQQVLAIRNDYDLYLRHYTEGVVETVMFFIPKKHVVI